MEGAPGVAGEVKDRAPGARVTCAHPLLSPQQRAKIEAAADRQLLDKYGRLPKKNAVFAHALKKDKQFFDSGEWQLQRQGGLGQLGMSTSRSYSPLACAIQANRPCRAPGHPLHDAGLPDYGLDRTQRPLAYDHHTGALPDHGAAPEPGTTATKAEDGEPADRGEEGAKESQ